MKFKENTHLKLWMSTILFAVALFAALTNLGSLAQFFSKALGLIRPLSFGFALALILNVPLRGLEKLLKRLDKKDRLGEKHRKRLCLLIVFLSAPLLLFAIIMFFVPEFVNAISDLVSSINRNQDQIIAFTSQFGLDEENIKGYIQEIGVWVNGNLKSVLGITVNTALSIVSTLTSAVMCIMLAVYILIDKKRIGFSAKRILHAFLPKHAASYICRAGSLFINQFSRFLSSQCLEALILGSILFIGMTIFRLPHALSICSITVVFALVPYIGAMISLFLGAIMILLNNPNEALIFAVMFLILQQIEDNVIYPRIVGESVGLPAHLTLIAVSVGGGLMGIAGMMLFVPITSVAYILVDEAVKHRLPLKKGPLTEIASAPPAAEDHPPEKRRKKNRKRR